METILTPDGARRLEEQLEYLKTVARKEVAEQIRVAREFGDISENAEYDEAKNAQAHIEGQIVELEKKLRSARIVNGSSTSNAGVMIGSCVSLRDDTGEAFELTIGGATEADPLHGIITNESPLGQALLGQQVGASLEVNAPAGTRTYTILKID